jgi:HEAT repeat protein
MVFPPKEILDADALLQELHANRLVGHSRAIAIHEALGSFDEPTLARLAPTLFGDGSVSSLVAQRYAMHPGMALELARNFAGQGESRFTMKGWSAPGRVARFTTVQVLQRILSSDARKALKEIAISAAQDPALQNLIQRALHPDSLQKIPDPILDGLKAGNWEARIEALSRVVAQGCLAALPHVRRIAAIDPSLKVRFGAWYAQAALLDVDAVPLWIAVLKNRATDDDAGREALHALAHIGDNRSIAPLLDAFEEGYKPTLVADALHAFGPAIMPPLLDRVEARAELVDRKVTVDVCAAMGLSVASELLEQRLADASPESWPMRALLYLKMFSKNAALQKAVATLVQARIESAGLNPVPGDLKRALSRAISKGK